MAGAKGEPPCHGLARRQLNDAGIRVKEIVHVSPEAILFVNGGGVPITAWSEVRESGALAFYCERGFPAHPSACG